MLSLKLFSTATFKDSLVLLIGSFISTVFNILLTLILTNNLSTSEFGLIITALTFSQIVVDLFGLGIGTAVVNFIPGLDSTNKKIIIKTTLVLRVLTALLVSIFVYIFSKEISIIIFHNLSIITYIKMSSIGIFAMMILFWGQTLFQAEGRFLLASIIGNIGNVIRVFAVGILIILGIFNSSNVYLTLQIVTLVLVVYIFFKIGLSYLSVNEKKTDYLKILRFGLPAGIGFSIAAIYTKLDQILILNIAGESEAGLYGLAFRLVSILVLATASFNLAITPRFSSISRQDFKNYFKKTMLVAGVLSLLAVLGIVLIPLLLPVLFPKYTQSILPLQILGIGTILFILSSPIFSALLYHFKKPNFSLIISSISLVLVWSLLELLIPIYKSIGAAIAVTLVYLFQLVTASFYFMYLDKD